MPTTSYYFMFFVTLACFIFMGVFLGMLQHGARKAAERYFISTRDAVIGFGLKTQELIRDMHRTVRDMHRTVRDMHRTVREVHRTVREVHQTSGRDHREIIAELKESRRERRAMMEFLKSIEIKTLMILERQEKDKNGS